MKTGIEPSVESAAMGIRTPVEGVRVPHDWPDYTIAANCSHIWVLVLLKSCCIGAVLSENLRPGMGLMQELCRKDNPQVYVDIPAINISK
jgi:hypothetical protein